MEGMVEIDEVKTYDELVILMERVQSDELLEDYLRANGLIKTNPRCCKRRMKRVGDPNSIASRSRWRCVLCRKSRAILRGSFFENTKMHPFVILRLAFLYVEAGARAHDFRVLMGIKSPTSLTDWLQFIRDVLSQDLKSTLRNKQVGGPGKLVHIGRTKLSKKKYHSKRSVGQEHIFLLGIYAVEHRIAIVEIIPNWSAPDIISIIQKNVCIESTVCTDGSDSYSSLKSLGYDHRTVGNEKEAGSAGSVHTNHIKSCFSRLKTFLARKRARESSFLRSYLDEFMWRELHKEEMWGVFLSALRHQYCP